MASLSHKTKTSPHADVWSWGAVLYRMTYHVPPDFTYQPPCDRPPKRQPPARDPHLRQILHHTLVIDPAGRPDIPWLVEHPYTKSL